MARVLKNTFPLLAAEAVSVLRRVARQQVVFWVVDRWSAGRSNAATTLSTVGAMCASIRRMCGQVERGGAIAVDCVDRIRRAQSDGRPWIVCVIGTSADISVERLTGPTV